MNLAGRSAIITGASQGLGQAIAQAFVEEGANLMLCARGAALLEETRQEIAGCTRHGQQVLAQVCDVSEPDDVKRLVDTARAHLGDVQILVNDAGVYGPKGELEMVNWVEWTRTIEVNLYGTVLPTREMLPHLKAAGYGKIVNLSGGGATARFARRRW